MSLHRSNCGFHSGAYLQRGRGLGGIFRSFYSKLVPVLKTVGNIILESPVTQNVLEAAKNSAVNAGLNIAAETLAGGKVRKAVKRNFALAKQEIEGALLSGVRRVKKRKKIEETPTVFDDDELELSD